jgi:hypothetical protein
LDLKYIVVVAAVVDGIVVAVEIVDLHDKMLFQ